MRGELLLNLSRGWDECVDFQEFACSGDGRGTFKSGARLKPGALAEMVTTQARSGSGFVDTDCRVQVSTRSIRRDAKR